MRPRGVLQDAVPQPADEVREAAPEVAQPADGQFGGDRAAVFRKTGRKDAHRDLDQGHAPVGEFVLLAVHVILQTVLGVLVKVMIILISFFLFNFYVDKREIL